MGLAARLRPLHSADRRLLAAILTIGGLTVLVRGTGIAKQLLVAYRFGTGDALDAFLAALALPTFVVTVVEGSFNAAFIPTYVTTRKAQGDAEAARLLESVAAFTVVILALLSGVLLFFDGPLVHLVASGFGPGKQALARSLLWMLLPMIAAGGLTSIWGAALNARGKFALAALAPLMTPLLPTVALLVGARFGIYALVVGTLAGAFAESALVGLALARQGIRLWPRWHGMTPPMRRVLGQFAPMIAGGLLMSSSSLVDQAMAATLGQGSLSTLAYASRMPSFAIGVASLSLGTAVLPHFSEQVAERDFAAVRRTLRLYGGLLGALVVPATILAVAYSTPLARLFFERGAFSATDALAVGRVQAFYFLQAPFYLLGILGVRLLSALESNHVLFAISGVNVLTNVGGDWLLMHRFGLPGIALSTALVYVCSLGLIAVAVARKLPACA